MKKLNRKVIAKYASRFFLVLMSFMLILSLCSMASSSDVIYGSISNPNNIPQDMTITINDVVVSIGDFAINGLPVYASDGLLYIDSESAPDSFPTLPDGDYLLALIVTEQDPSYNSKLHVDGDVHYGPKGSFVTVADSISCEFVEDTSNIGFDLLFVLVPTVPSPTESITSVWTSITNWVISSLNTVQGLFYGAGEEVITPDTSSSDTVEYNGVTYYPIDSSRIAEASGGRVYFNGVEISEDDFGQSATTINGQQYLVVSNGGVPFMLTNPTTNGTYSPVGLEIVFQFDGSLTLLGSLAVIGLSIAIVFLLIGIIQRFLRLRG